MKTEIILRSQIFEGRSFEGSLYFRDLLTVVKFIAILGGSLFSKGRCFRKLIANS